MNINKITQYILQNYDENTENLIRLLSEIDCDLIYNGNGLKDAILNRKVYSCSIRLRIKRNKILNNVYPVLIGSKLDSGIRRFQMTEFTSLDKIPNILEYWNEGEKVFEPPDIAVTCFLINGILRQIPFYISNNSNNAHIPKNNKSVRIYRYDSDERGAQLSMYFDAEEDFKRGDLIIKLNSGRSIKVLDETSPELNAFFDCPYTVKPRVYFKEIFSKHFEIDNLNNKIVISPGCLFYKLFKKTLFVPLKYKNNILIRKKHLIVSKCIKNGDLLHIISKKTIFHKEMNLKNKMVNNNNCNVEIPTEISETGEIFTDRPSTCYRDANCQIYPYLPYLSNVAHIQISNKVKDPSVLAFNDSYKGFLCIFGTSEGKNVGRSMTLAKNTFVSTQENLDQVYQELHLEEGLDKLYVVVNCACIEVTKLCFESIGLINLKRCFKFIECYKSDKFIYINYKVGLLYKKLEDDLWVTSGDIHFWMRELYGFTNIEQLIELKGYDFIVSHSTDIIKYFKHNVYPKNILTLNTLKNGILSNTPEYSLYFLETVSAYSLLTEKHKPILKPENKLSEYYVMYLPRLNLMYASFKGSTQEDCIAVSSKVRAFDCYRLYTVKIKFQNENTKYFHATQGLPDPAELKSFLGTIVCPTNEIRIVSQTMHLWTKVIDKNIVEIFFQKPNFHVLTWHISHAYLFICISSFHKFSYGDKLCSLHGQKGVAVIFDSLPRSKYIDPDLIINPYTLVSRQTMGQIEETKALGGKDYGSLQNSDGIPIPGKAFIGPVSYFNASYLSSEHIYIGKKCIKDKITGHPIRGRARQGGLKVSTLGLFNCLLGNGIAASAEEKLFEHSDSIIVNGVPVPKSTILCCEDAKCHKCKITYKVRQCIEDV